MSEFALPPLEKVDRRVREALELLANHLNSSRHVAVRRYTAATKPAAGDVGAGVVIFVSDAANKFQGSDGTNWVNLS